MIDRERRDPERRIWKAACAVLKTIETFGSAAQPAIRRDFVG